MQTWKTNPERSLLLGLTALDNAYTFEAEEVVRAALQTSRIELTLTNDDENGYSVVYHPDGTWLAAIDNNDNLIIWDAKNGETLQTILLNQTGARLLTISPDGSRLAYSVQNSIFLLDTNSLKVIQELEGHSENLSDIEFSPDSLLLASGSADGVLKIWQVASGEEQFSVKASDFGWLNDLTFSHDGSKVATAGDDFTARVWDVSTGEELVRILVNGDDVLWVYFVAFNFDDSRLFVIPATLTDKANISSWDIETLTGSELTEPATEWVSPHTNFPTKMILSPDGRFLATASQDSTVILWDVTRDSPVEAMTLSGHLKSVTDIEFSPDSQQIVSASDQVRIWDISEAGYGEILNIADPSIPFAFTPDNQSLTTVSDDGIVKIWDVSTGNLIDEFDTQVRNINNYSVAVSADGIHMAIGGNDNLVTIVNMQSYEVISTITGHGEGTAGGIFTGIMGLDFSPDGSLLASAGADGYAKVWDVATGTQLYVWRVDPRNSVWSEEELPNALESVKFSPDGRFLAASTDESQDEEGNFGGGIIKIWELDSGSEIMVVDDSPRRINAIAFSPDNKYVAGVGSSGVIRVWDVNTGERIANLEGETTTIGAVLFSKDGSQLITGRSSIVIWDIESEEAIVTLPQGLRPIVLSSDGKYLAATGEQGIHIYTLDFEELIEIANTRVTRDLTEAECKEYLHVDTCPEN